MFYGALAKYFKDQIDVGGGATDDTLVVVNRTF